MVRFIFTTSTETVRDLFEILIRQHEVALFPQHSGACPQLNFARVDVRPAHSSRACFHLLHHVPILVLFA